MELGTDPRRRSSGREEDEEELLRRRQLQEEQLMKLNSGLGQLILKEEMEKESRERASLLASRYDSPLHSGEQHPSPTFWDLRVGQATCLQKDRGTGWIVTQETGQLVSSSNPLSPF